MALPVDLRLLIFRYLPLQTWENFATVLPRVALQARYPLTATLRDQLSEGTLRPLELYEKVATLQCEPGYSNSKFLPLAFALQMAGLFGSPALFLDVFLRNFDNIKQSDSYQSVTPYIFAAALAEIDGIKLSYLLAYDFLPSSITYLVWQLRLGQLVIPESNRARLLYWLTNHRNTRKETTELMRFFFGYFLALNKMQPPPNMHYDDVFIQGYLVAGGRDLTTLRQLKFTSYQIVGVYAWLGFELPEDLQSIDTLNYNEKLSLANFAAFIISDLPRSGTREFPALEKMSVLPWFILRERAEILHEIIPQIYAPANNRDNYLTLLRFIMDPAASYSDFEKGFIRAASTISLLFDRPDISGYDVLGDFDKYRVTDFYRGPDAFMAQSPQLLAQRLLNRVTPGNHATMLTHVSYILPTLVARRELWALAQHRNFNFATIETLGRLRSIGNNRITIQNSFLLQALLPECTMQQNFDELRLYRANSIFTHFIVNDYEATTWRNLGLVVVVRSIVNPAIMQLLTALLAL